MVEPQPSKLTVWVRFPSPAPIKNQDRIEAYTVFLLSEFGILERV